MLDVERPNLVEELAETFDQSIQLTLEVFNQSFSLGFGELLIFFLVVEVLNNNFLLVLEDFTNNIFC